MIRTFEILEDHSEVAHAFAEHGSVPPPKEVSRIIVARDDNDKISGLVTLEMVYHGGPLWVRQDMRGQRLAYELFDELDRYCRENLPGAKYYNFPIHPAIERILGKRGHTKLASSVWESPRF